MSETALLSYQCLLKGIPRYKIIKAGISSVGKLASQSLLSYTFLHDFFPKVLIFSAKAWVFVEPTELHNPIFNLENYSDY